jgi:hypothetical protein
MSPALRHGSGRTARDGKGPGGRRPRSLLSAPLLAAICWLGAGLDPAAAGPVLNEVLYDPAGADGGAEFVELHQPGDTAVALADARLEFANGADGPVWRVRWRGGADDTLRAGGFFLIADEGWQGPPADAQVSLQLQNGPDAIRLVLADGRMDVLGYGELEDPGLYETTPHADVPSGQALARRPDGQDTDRNDVDWVAAVPSPGAANFQRYGASVDAFKGEPPSLPAVGGEVTLTLRLFNTGLADLPAGPVILTDVTTGEGLNAWLDGLPPDQGRTLVYHWRAQAEGRHRFQLDLEGGENGPGADEGPPTIPAGYYQVGPAGLYLNEVMVAPTTSGEWIEIANGGAAAVSLDSFRVRDEDSTWRPLPALTLLPGDFALLVQDRERFLSWWERILAEGALPSCGATGPAAAATQLNSGWPSLNNAPPDDREFADRVYLGDAQETVLDHLTCGGRGLEIPAGRSLERLACRPRGAVDRNWGPSTSPLGGTPACANSLATGPATGFELRPNPFYPGGGGEQAVLHLLFHLRAGENGWEALVFDLWGRRVRDLGGDDLGPGPRDILWDGRGDGGSSLPPGGYVVLLRIRDGAGRPQTGLKRLVVIGGGP